MSRISAIRDSVHSYLLKYPDERVRLEPLIRDLEEAADLCDRKRKLGHVTASGIVERDGALLMIFHPVLQKWLQPGGHVEENELPLDAARREVLEETGILCDAKHESMGVIVPLDIDVHRIPENQRKNEPEHWHYDFRYVLVPSLDLNAENGEHEFDWIKTSNVKEKHLQALIRKL